MPTSTRIMSTGQPRIVIIGGGFAGVALAKALQPANAQVVLLDRNNHHTFQPLLYQVATASLEGDTIVHPFRKMFENQPNFYFRLGEVIRVDTESRTIETSIGKLTYDYLVVATGATTNFYGNTEIETHAVPLKTVEDALRLRNQILANFEEALLTEDHEQMNSLMDYVIVGGGPTGVEVAGALGELKKYVFPSDYRELNLFDMDVHLIHSGPRLLNAMSEESSRKAEAFLRELGVEIWLNSRVTSYDGYTVTLNNGQKLITKTLLWAAGVCGVPLPGLRPDCIGENQRLKVDEYGRVAGYDNLFAAGDAAVMVTPDMPKGYPMMASPAMQQGKHVAQNLLRVLSNQPLEKFQYVDKGCMATIGQNRAVVESNPIKTQGFRAWIVWMIVHWHYLAGRRNKAQLLLNWFWSYFSRDKGIRLIIGHRRVAEKQPEPETEPVL